MLPLPIAKINKKAVRILTEQGQSMIDIEKMYRVSDKLCMQGKLMGQFPTKVYLSGGDFYRMLVMLLKPAPLSFVLLSSFYLLRKRLRDIHIGRK
jgi:hypothetical protein